MSLELQRSRFTRGLCYKYVLLDSAFAADKEVTYRQGITVASSRTNQVQTPFLNLEFKLGRHVFLSADQRWNTRAPFLSIGARAPCVIRPHLGCHATLLPNGRVGDYS